MNTVTYVKHINNIANYYAAKKFLKKFNEIILNIN